MIKHKKQKNHQLWVNFKSEKDVGKKIILRNELVNYYYPFLTKVAYALIEKINWNREIDELISFGFDGLIDAINKYDLDKKIKFETYARQRVSGSMIDNIRKEDIIPRSVRLNAQKIDKTRQKLESKKQDKVFDYEILRDLNIRDSEYHKNCKKYIPIEIESIDGINLEDDFKQEFSENIQDKKNLNPLNKIYRKEFLKEIFNGDLNILEKNIIFLYYYKNYTMKNISKILNISESRISQKHKKILQIIKSKIEQNPNFFEKNIINTIYGN
jgi:RNA polymerase sigma factor for flagellar operon FliA